MIRKKNDIQKQETAGHSAELPEKAKSSDHLREDFPIVGIGASAGGLAAFEAFFSGMPKGREESSDD